MKKLSHSDKSGKVKMVDVSAKQTTTRRAIASAKVHLSSATLKAVRNHTTPKGNPLEIARIAGILAAKKTSDLIPLCHQISLNKADIVMTEKRDGVLIESEVITNAQTGVEMEALTAVSIAALTLYDMCKAIQKDIVISDIRLERKTGGKTDYRRKVTA